VLAACARTAQHWRGAAALVAVACSSAARAEDVGNLGGFDVKWDTTVRVSLGLRTEGQNSALLANVNADDGDRAFAHGLISDRLDVQSEITAEREDLGFDVSGQGWYDRAYHGSTDNDSPATFNGYSVAYDQFPKATRQLMGGDAELLNAFGQDRFTVFGLPASVRVGRQTLLWGESLFFANNGIAAGQAPVDDIKALSAPLATAQELYLPVTQLVGRIELRPGLALEAYDQFEWRRDRLPGVASYFSTTDLLDAGGEDVLFPGIPHYPRIPDREPHGAGQFGVALRAQSDSLDFGLYALRYDAKLPEVLFDKTADTYQLVFPRNIQIYGASASTYIGDSTLAGELSWRRNMPVVSRGPAILGASGVGGGQFYGAAIDLSGVPPPPVTHEVSSYATGDTLHGQVSLVTQFPPSRWWQAATLQTEIAANDLSSVNGGDAFVQAGRTHFATSVRSVFIPQYFQVLPGLDLAVPVGLTYTPVGRSSVDGSQNAGTGNATVSVTATYHQVWLGNISYTHFIGGPTAQELADRDFVEISITRTF
jgi:hypothetical protein